MNVAPRKDSPKDHIGRSEKLCTAFAGVVAKHHRIRIYKVALNSMKTGHFNPSICHSYDDRVRKSHGMILIQKDGGGGGSCNPVNRPGES